MSESQSAPRGAPSAIARWLPSPPAVVFLLAVAIVSVFFSDRLVLRTTDGDLPRHLAHGRWMNVNGVVRHDPYSFSMPGAPIVETEYGWQMITAWVYDHLGLVAVAVLSVLTIAATYAVQCRLLLRRGVPPSLAVVATTLAAWMASQNWVARPHLVSILAVALLLWMYLSENVRRQWWAVLFFALWANLHPGWAFGIVLLGILTAGHVLEWLIAGRKADDEWQRALKCAWLFGSAAIGSLMQPYGIKLHRWIYDFLHLRYNLDTIAEWRSPDFHSTYQIGLMIGLLTIVFALGASGRRMRMPWLLAIVFLVYQSLHSSRHKPYLGMVAMTFLAIHLAPEWSMLRDRIASGLAERERRWLGGASRLWYAAGIAALVALVVLDGRFAGKEIVPRRFSEEQFPLELVARTRAKGVQGRLFTSIQWGGFVDLLWPEQKVFIDGSGDFFGDELLRETVQLRDRSPGWTDIVKKWDFNLMLLRRGSPLAMDMGRLPGWYVVDCDQRAVLLVRQEAAPASAPAGCTTALASARSRGATSE